jgi:hypothetical protein
MKKTTIPALSMLVLFLSLALVACGGNTTAAAAPVSDGSEDLKIDFQLNTTAADPTNNYFTFAGNIRYMAAEKDQVDVTTGASTLRSTEVFQAYLYDVEGKTTMSSGLRGLFLFGVNTFSSMEDDNLVANKAADGTITVQFTHRGTAYRIMTDKNGKLSFPNGSFESRAIGYIKGGGPQVISTDFSADGTAATVDYAKVWDSSVAGGKIITEGVANKTGDIAKNVASADSMYYFGGTLDASLAGGILKIAGALTAVPRR